MQRTDDAQRRGRLLDVGRSLLSELHLEPVLDRLLETARELTGARYAALGILDEDRRELARFLTRGVDEETAPRDRRPAARPRRARRADRRPAAAAPATTSARTRAPTASRPATRRWRRSSACRSLIRGEAWGNLYLTEKDGGEQFDDDDEEAVVVLADWAAIAIDNARLYESLDARRDELERAVRGFEATTRDRRARSAARPTSTACSS